MALSSFTDKARPPTDEDLRSTLGPTYEAWVELIALVSSRVPQLNRLWAFTSKSTGWGLRLRHKARVILYMTPCDEHFLVSVALGEKAVTQARLAKLPKSLLAAIEGAPRYAEGRGLRIPVRKVSQVPSLAALAEIKHRN